MSNSVAGGSLVHYNDQHIQVRKDFFDLCAYDKADFNQGTTRNGKKVKNEPNQECMAKLLRLFETLTDSRKQEWYLKAERCKAKKIKPPVEPSEHRIELAYSTIVALLYGTYGESTIRNSIAVLLARGYILRYQETKNSIPCYVLNVPVLQKALEQQSNGNEVSNSTPEESEVSKSTAEVSKSTAEVSKSTAEVSISTPNNIKDKRVFKKEDKREKPTVTQEPQLSSQPNASFPPLSQKNEEETKPTEVNYNLFDHLCQEKGYAPDFKVPRNDKNNAAIQELCSQNATVEQVTFVFNDIWNDKDTWWHQHRGKPSAVASQFTARVWKMTAPAQKRQTLTGTSNWTEDRIGVSAQEAKPAPVLHIVKPAPQPTYGPKLDQEPTYTRLKFEKPGGPRSLQARLQQAKGEK